MPPWRKGRGLGPFTSAQPAAGPLLSSQLVWPQTTQNSRSLGNSRHANEHLWSVARAAARRRRRPPFRLTSAHQPVGHGWPYWALTATAEAVVPGARRLDRRAYSRTRRGCAPGGHPCRLGIDASAAERCFTRRASRPPGSGVGSGSGVARSRGVAATLRRCGHTGWNQALRFGAGLDGYSCDTGNKPQPSAGPSPRPACVEVARQPVRPVLPLHSAFGMRSSARQRLRGLPASVP